MRISDWSSDVCSSDLHVSVWSLVDFHLVYTFRVSDDTVRCISLSPDERQIAFGCRDNLIRIYDTTELSLLAELNGHTMSVFRLHYGPDEIGRASCRAQVCQYVYISGVAVSLKKKKKK